MTNSVYKVFTPSTVATLSFVERERINDRLVDAIKTPGKQIIVFGRSGGGKTTLLRNKLKQLYDKEIITRCTKTHTFEQCILDALDQLDQYYTSEVVTTQSAKLNADLKVLKTGLGLGRELSSSTTASRLLPPQLTPNLLARLLGASNSCWVVEDVHKLEKGERVKFAQTMKLFMDMATDFPELKMIAIGAAGSGREVLEADDEMSNRVTEVEVDLMLPDEIAKIITHGESLMNVRLGESNRQKVVHFASGLPAVCHQLCLNLCLQHHLYETATSTMRFSSEDLDRAVGTWLEDTTDTLRKQYDVATAAERTRKFDNCRLILHSLSRFEKEGATHNEIKTHIQRDRPDYPSGNVTQYLDKLTSSARDSVLVRDAASNRYSFSSPMMHAYVRVIVAKAEAANPESAKKVTSRELLKILEAFGRLV